jgi:EF hand
MRIKSALALSALVLIGACATEHGRHRHGRHGDWRGEGQPGGGGPGAARRQMLFISPMGEPFRAANPGERGVDLWFAAADADGDGAISHDEFLANAAAFFTKLDANQDGSATSAESSALWAREAPEVIGAIDEGPVREGNPVSEGRRGGHGGRGRRGGGGGGGYPGGEGGERGEGGGEGGPEGGGVGERAMAMRERGEGAQPFGLLGDAEPVMSCDSDFSRRVTAEEFTTCATERFAQLDLNHDGRFTRDEIHFWREHYVAPEAPPAAN